MRMAALRQWTGLLAIVGGLVRFAAPAAAQVQTLPGQVLDARDQPVAGLEVFLHRVTQGGGMIVATDTTDASGAFQLSVETDSSEAVFFVAARYEEQLHIGPMMRSPFPSDDYVLRLGANPVNIGTAATADATAAADTGEGRGVILAVMGTLLVIAGFAVHRSMRPPARRRLLLRLAEIEEARAASGSVTSDAELERSRILARLRFGRST